MNTSCFPTEDSIRNMFRSENPPAARSFFPHKGSSPHPLLRAVGAGRPTIPIVERCEGEASVLSWVGGAHFHCPVSTIISPLLWLLCFLCALYVLWRLHLALRRRALETCGWLAAVEAAVEAVKRNRIASARKEAAVIVPSFGSDGGSSLAAPSGPSAGLTFGPQHIGPVDALREMSTAAGEEEEVVSADSSSMSIASSISHPSAGEIGAANDTTHRDAQTDGCCGDVLSALPSEDLLPADSTRVSRIALRKRLPPIDTLPQGGSSSSSSSSPDRAAASDARQQTQHSQPLHAAACASSATDLIPFAPPRSTGSTFSLTGLVGLSVSSRPAPSLSFSHASLRALSLQWAERAGTYAACEARMLIGGGPVPSAAAQSRFLGDFYQMLGTAVDFGGSWAQTFASRGSTVDGAVRSNISTLCAPSSTENAGLLPSRGPSPVLASLVGDVVVFSVGVHSHCVRHEALACRAVWSLHALAERYAMHCGQGQGHGGATGVVDGGSAALRPPTVGSTGSTNASAHRIGMGLRSGLASGRAWLPAGDGSPSSPHSPSVKFSSSSVPEISDAAASAALLLRLAARRGAAVVATEGVAEHCGYHAVPVDFAPLPSLGLNLRGGSSADGASDSGSGGSEPSYSSSSEEEGESERLDFISTCVSDGRVRSIRRPIAFPPSLPPYGRGELTAVYQLAPLAKGAGAADLFALSGGGGGGGGTAAALSGSQSNAAFCAPMTPMLAGRHTPMPYSTAPTPLVGMALHHSATSASSVRRPSAFAAYDAAASTSCKGAECSLSAPIAPATPVCSPRHPLRPIPRCPSSPLERSPIGGVIGRRNGPPLSAVGSAAELAAMHASEGALLSVAHHRAVRVARGAAAVHSSCAYGVSGVGADTADCTAQAGGDLDNWSHVGCGGFSRQATPVSNKAARTPVPSLPPTPQGLRESFLSKGRGGMYYAGSPRPCPIRIGGGGADRSSLHENVPSAAPPRTLLTPLAPRAACGGGHPLAEPEASRLTAAFALMKRGGLKEARAVLLSIPLPRSRQVRRWIRACGAGIAEDAAARQRRDATPATVHRRAARGVAALHPDLRLYPYSHSRDASMCGDSLAQSSHAPRKHVSRRRGARFLRRHAFAGAFIGWEVDGDVLPASSDWAEAADYQMRDEAPPSSAVERRDVSPSPTARARTHSACMVSTDNMASLVRIIRVADGSPSPFGNCSVGTSRSHAPSTDGGAPRGAAAGVGLGDFSTEVCASGIPAVSSLLPASPHHPSHSIHSGNSGSNTRFSLGASGAFVRQGSFGAGAGSGGGTPCVWPGSLADGIGVVDDSSCLGTPTVVRRCAPAAADYSGSYFDAYCRRSPYIGARSISPQIGYAQRFAGYVRRPREVAPTGAVTSLGSHGVMGACSQSSPYPPSASAVGADCFAAPDVALDAGMDETGPVPIGTEVVTVRRVRSPSLATLGPAHPHPPRLVQAVRCSGAPLTAPPCSTEGERGASPDLLSTGALPLQRVGPPAGASAFPPPPPFPLPLDFYSSPPQRGLSSRGISGASEARQWSLHGHWPDMEASRVVAEQTMVFPPLSRPPCAQSQTLFLSPCDVSTAGAEVTNAAQTAESTHADDRRCRCQGACACETASAANSNSPSLLFALRPSYDALAGLGVAAVLRVRGESDVGSEASGMGPPPPLPLPLPLGQGTMLVATSVGTEGWGEADADGGSQSFGVGGSATGVSRLSALSALSFRSPRSGASGALCFSFGKIRHGGVGLAPLSGLGPLPALSADHGGPAYGDDGDIHIEGGQVPWEAPRAVSGSGSAVSRSVADAEGAAAAGPPACNASYGGEGLVAPFAAAASHVRLHGSPPHPFPSAQGSSFRCVLPSITAHPFAFPNKASRGAAFSNSSSVASAEGDTSSSSVGGPQPFVFHSSMDGLGADIVNTDMYRDVALPADEEDGCFPDTLRSVPCASPSSLFELAGRGQRDGQAEGWGLDSHGVQVSAVGSLQEPPTLPVTWRVPHVDGEVGEGLRGEEQGGRATSEGGEAPRPVVMFMGQGRPSRLGAAAPAGRTHSAAAGSARSRSDHGRSDCGSFGIGQGIRTFDAFDDGDGGGDLCGGNNEPLPEGGGVLGHALAAHERSILDSDEAEAAEEEGEDALCSSHSASSSSRSDTGPDPTYWSVPAEVRRASPAPIAHAYESHTTAGAPNSAHFADSRPRRAPVAPPSHSSLPREFYVGARDTMFIRTDRLVDEKASALSIAVRGGRGVGVATCVAISPSNGRLHGVQFLPFTAIGARTAADVAAVEEQARFATNCLGVRGGAGASASMGTGPLQSLYPVTAGLSCSGRASPASGFAAHLTPSGTPRRNAHSFRLSPSIAPHPTPTHWPHAHRGGLARHPNVHGVSEWGFVECGSEDLSATLDGYCPHSGTDGADVARGCLWLLHDTIPLASVRGLIDAAGPSAAVPFCVARLFLHGALRGLAALHGAGVVHGLLRPEALVVGADGSCAVADGHLSRLVLASDIVDEHEDGDAGDASASASRYSSQTPFGRLARFAACHLAGDAAQYMCPEARASSLGIDVDAIAPLLFSSGGPPPNAVGAATDCLNLSASSGGGGSRGYSTSSPAALVLPPRSPSPSLSAAAVPYFTSRHDCSPRHDMYSLGLIFFEMLTGLSPREAGRCDGDDASTSPHCGAYLIPPAYLQLLGGDAPSEASRQPHSLASFMEGGGAGAAAMQCFIRDVAFFTLAADPNRRASAARALTYLF